jgi:hypothetical protein
MFIVCTQDRRIRDWAVDPASHSGAWGEVRMLPIGGFPRADERLRRLVESVTDEPLCLAAHGNDDEIGDEHRGWGWSYQVLASMFVSRTTPYGGPILIWACAKNVVNFSANLAVELGRCHVMAGVWIYGYNRAVGIGTVFPDPHKLDKSVALQGTRVPWMEEATG